MSFRLLVLDVSKATYPFVIARELKKLCHHVVLGIPFNNKIRPELVLSLKGYKRILFPDSTISKQEFIKWIKEIVYQYKFDFIIPFVEYTQLSFAEIKGGLESIGITLPIPDYHTIEKIVNKSYVVKKAMELGLGVPKTLFYGE